jgi:cytochrome P450
MGMTETMWPGQMLWELTGVGGLGEQQIPRDGHSNTGPSNLSLCCRSRDTRGDRSDRIYCLRSRQDNVLQEPAGSRRGRTGARARGRKQVHANGGTDRMTPLPEVDIFAPDVLKDPAPFYNELRERSRVVLHAVPGSEAFVITRHEDIWRLKRRPGLLSARYGNIPLPEGVFRGGLYNDLPAHSQFRRMFSDAHSSAGVRGLETVMNEVMDDLLSRIRDKGSCDLVQDLAYYFPGEIVGRIIGAPTEKRQHFALWTEELLLASNTNDPARAADVWDTVMAYFGELIDEREAMLEGVAEVDLEQAIGTVLPDDLASRVVVGNLTVRPMPRAEQQRMLQHQMVGGSDTTIALTANAMWRTLLDPALYDKVGRNRSLDEALVEESLRFDPPAVGVYASNNQEIDLDGVTIPRGSRLFTLHMAANRDPRVWQDPDSFILDRDLAESRRKTLTFSAGIHNCQGARLARAEGRIAIRKILDTLPNLRLAGPTTRNPVFLLWGRRSLPVAWDVGAAAPAT